MICSWVRKGRKGEIPFYPHQGLLALWGKGLWRRVRQSLCVDEIHALQGSVPPSSPRGQFINSASVLARMVHLLPWIQRQVDIGVKMARVLWTCFLKANIVELKKTLESPLDSKEIQPIQPKGNQPWTFTGRTDAEAEAPTWPSDVKSWLIGKDSDAGKDWRQGEKETTEDELVGWHHQLNGHEFQETSGDSEGQGSLAFCSPWGSRTVRHALATEQQQKAKIKLETSKGLQSSYSIGLSS